MRITSTQNSLVKYVRSLERAQTRRDEKAYLIEGIRLVREAIQARRDPVLVMYDPDALQRTASGAALERDVGQWTSSVFEVTANVLHAAAQTDSPSGVLAVLPRESPPPFETHASARFGVVLDGMADPGNLGTVLRTADAAAVDFVALTPRSVDPFNPKAVRAGMGAHFRLHIYSGLTWTEIFRALPLTHWVAIDAQAATSICHFEWPERSGLVVGSEAHGLSQEVRENLRHVVRIPMRQGVESLNAAVAASIALYAAQGSKLCVDL